MLNRLLLVAAASAVTSSAYAAPTVQGAWSRPAAKGGVGVGFMTMANASGKPDSLVAVESPAAREVQIHQSSVSGGMASMRPVTAVPIAVGAKVVFAPGGYHLMFLGLKRPLSVGDTLAGTLVFASGARVKAAFAVGLSAPADPHAHHGAH